MIDKTGLGGVGGGVVRLAGVEVGVGVGLEVIGAIGWLVGSVVVVPKGAAGVAGFTVVDAA